MGNIIMQSEPYLLSVTVNVLCQMTISPKVNVIKSQSKSLYIGLGPNNIDWSPYLDCWSWPNLQI